VFCTVCVCEREREKGRESETERNSELVYIEINQKDLLVYWMYPLTYLVSS